MDKLNRPVDRPFFLRRFPEGIRSRIADEARASERSLTAEIIHRLRQSLRGTHEGSA
jgi:hypothetical protein